MAYKQKSQKKYVYFLTTNRISLKKWNKLNLIEKSAIGILFTKMTKKRLDKFKRHPIDIGL